MLSTCEERKPPVDPQRPVRLPGASAMAGLRAANVEGLRLHDGIIENLVPWAEKFGVSLPQDARDPV